MIEALREDILKLVTAEFGFTAHGEWLQKGKCPSCGHKELFARREAPFWLRCGRENKCGWSSNIKELHPEMFEGFNKRFKPTDENPNATADAYLALQRGFNLTLIRGWYEQGRFWHPHGDKGTATVRFHLDAERTAYMERLVETVLIADEETGAKKPRKAHFKGPHHGIWWQPPGLEIVDGDEVWIVEGILDAIALFHHGVKAVAALSCVNFPSISLDAHKGKWVTWVIAFDADEAGQKFTEKFAKKLRANGYTPGAAQPPRDGGKKIDWNDLHQQQRLEAEDLKRWRHYGELLISKSAEAKAILIYRFKGQKSFVFEHDDQTYAWSLDLEAYQKAYEVALESHADATDDEIREQALRDSGMLTHIANCAVKFLYYQSAQNGDSWYYTRLTFPDRAAVQDTFTGAQIASATEFKKRMLGIAAFALYTGSGKQLDSLIMAQTRRGNQVIKTVQTVDFIGYDRERCVYVFPKIAVHNGVYHDLNKEDYFEVGAHALKTLSDAHLHINRDMDAFEWRWLDKLWSAFGPSGLATLTFWFGTLFAEQVREAHKSWPFFELVGEPGSGKSTLIEFLWKLYGRRDYEGFDPSKSTLSARSRNFAQVSNLPVVLIEADRDEEGARRGRFDWDELKTAYNGRSTRSRGVKSAGNETYEPPFRGAIVITQNATVQASDAVLQRICHLDMHCTSHTADTRDAARELEQMPVELVSGFVLKAAASELKVLDTFNAKVKGYEKMIYEMPSVRHIRIAKNHGQLLAMLDALCLIAPITDERKAATEDLILRMAEQRQQAISADHPIVANFWEAFDYLNKDERLNHSRNERYIAVNLNHFAEVANEKRQPCPTIQELKQWLKSSKTRKFLDVKNVNSVLAERTLKCWVFEV